MRDLATVLTEAGLDLTGWTLLTANGLSEDGSVIVGTGVRAGETYLQAWRAVLP